MGDSGLEFSIESLGLWYLMSIKQLRVGLIV